MQIECKTMKEMLRKRNMAIIGAQRKKLRGKK